MKCSNYQNLLRFFKDKEFNYFVGLQSPGKPRTVTKSNTVTAKPLTSGGSVGRRSTISYDAKAGSNEKTNITADLPGYVRSFFM